MHVACADVWKCWTTTHSSLRHVCKHTQSLISVLYKSHTNHVQNPPFYSVYITCLSHRCLVQAPVSLKCQIYKRHAWQPGNKEFKYCAGYQLLAVYTCKYLHQWLCDSWSIVTKPCDIWCTHVVQQLKDNGLYELLVEPSFSLVFILNCSRILTPAILTPYIVFSQVLLPYPCAVFWRILAVAWSD